MIHRQQQELPSETMGKAESTPITRAPARMGCPLIVVLTAKMRDELFALEIPQRVLQLRQLNEQVVLGVQVGGVYRSFEVERQPLLNATHAGALGKVEKQRDVEHDGRGQNAVAAQEVDLELHRVPQPTDQIDIVPAFLVVAARRIVINRTDVAQVLD